MIRFFTDEMGITPTRKDGDAGFDFYVPEFSDAFMNELLEKNGPDSARPCPVAWDFVMLPEYDQKDPKAQPKNIPMLRLEPGFGLKIPSHVWTSIPHNEAMIFQNKSGIATDTGLLVGACVIDSSYQGQVHIHVINTTPQVAFIPFGKKLAQAVPYFIDIDGSESVKGKLTEVTDADGKKHLIPTDENGNPFFTTKTERGDGGFGSTGLNK